MADYALMKREPIDVTEAGALDKWLKTVNNRIKGISVVHYTSPQVVILHCGDDALSEEDLEVLRTAVDAPLSTP